MAQRTTNLDLVLPIQGEDVLVQDVNGNMTKIDTFAGQTNQALAKFTSTTPTAITDFNSVITPGYYKAEPTAANAPASGYWVVSVLTYSSRDVAQLAIDVNLRKTYIRTLHDSTTWTTWQELALKSEVDPVTRSVFNYRNSASPVKTVTFNTGMTSNWQVGLLVININGAGNAIYAVAFNGSNTGVVTTLFGVAATAISATYSNGAITISTESFSFSRMTYIAV